MSDSFQKFVLGVLSLAVDAREYGMQAGCAVELAFRTAAGVEVGAIGACTDVTGWFLLAPEVVVSIAEASGTLGASIEAEVVGDFETFPKEEKALQCSGGVGLSHYG